MRNLVKSRMALFIGFVLAILSLFLALPMYNLANFNEHLDSFSSHIKNDDRLSAEKSLEQLKSDYNYLVDMKLRYFADNYWLTDTFLYEARLAYLADDCDRTASLLEGHEDDYRAVYLVGLCKLKLYQAAYQKAKTPNEKTDISNRASEALMIDFGRCVKDGPGIEKNFDCSFDYDLVSNPEALQDVLENSPPGPKFILGIPIDGIPGKKPGLKNPLDSKPQDGAGRGNLQRGG